MMSATDLNKGVTIRQAKDADKDSCMRLSRVIYGAGCYIEDVWDSWFDDGGLYVAESDHGVLGQVHCAVHDKQGWVEGVIVSPDAQNQGIGGKLFCKGQEFAKDHDSTIVRAIIVSDNISSIRCAKRHGWDILDNYNLIFVHSPEKASGKTCGSLYADTWQFYFGTRGMYIQDNRYGNGTIITIQNCSIENLRHAQEISGTARPRTLWDDGIKVVTSAGPSEAYEILRSFVLVGKVI